MAAESADISRDFVMLELRSVPGAADADALSRWPGQAGARAHAQWVGARGGPYPARSAGELPARRRRRRYPTAVATLYGWHEPHRATALRRIIELPAASVIVRREPDRSRYVQLFLPALPEGIGYEQAVGADGSAAPQLAPFADTRVYVYSVLWCKRAGP